MAKHQADLDQLLTIRSPARGVARSALSVRFDPPLTTCTRTPEMSRTGQSSIRALSAGMGDSKVRRAIGLTHEDEVQESIECE